MSADAADIAVERHGLMNWHRVKVDLARGYVRTGKLSSLLAEVLRSGAAVFGHR